MAVIFRSSQVLSGKVDRRYMLHQIDPVFGSEEAETAVAVHPAGIHTIDDRRPMPRADLFRGLRVCREMDVKTRFGDQTGALDGIDVFRCRTMPKIFGRYDPSLGFPGGCCRYQACGARGPWQRPPKAGALSSCRPHCEAAKCAVPPAGWDHLSAQRPHLHPGSSKPDRVSVESKKNHH